VDSFSDMTRRSEGVPGYAKASTIGLQLFLFIDFFFHPSSFASLYIEILWPPMDREKQLVPS